MRKLESSFTDFHSGALLNPISKNMLIWNIILVVEEAILNRPLVVNYT